MKRKLTALLLTAALAVSLGSTAMTAAAEPDTSDGDSGASYTYWFTYNGISYTISTCEWEAGSPMPTLQSSYDPNSGAMRGTDDKTVFEFVVGISKTTDTGSVPAEAEVFALVKEVSYTLEGEYYLGDTGTVTMSGTGSTVTRDTMLGTGSTVTTQAFCISVPAGTFINMDAIVTIKLDLDGDDTAETELTQRFNIQKLRSNAFNDHELTIPAGTTAEELKSILNNRQSIWTYYQKLTGCSVSELKKIIRTPLWIYLPAGDFGDLTTSLTTGNVFLSKEGGGIEAVYSSRPINIVGAESGTTVTSLDYIPDDSGMCNIGKIVFDGTDLIAEDTIGLKISSNESSFGGSVGVSDCTFTGYKTAVSVEGYGAATVTACTFTDNGTAVCINAQKTTYGGYPVVERCVFVRNQTGVLLESLGNGNPYNFRVTKCDFIDNTLDVSYQVAGRFYLLDNYYASTVNGQETLKGKADVSGAYYTAGTVIVQGIWRTRSNQSDVTAYGISNGGAVFNSGTETLTSEYLDGVSFDVIEADENGSETVGTWTFES